MASNIDVTLKRDNGTDVDVLLPTTHMGQVYTDDTLATLLGDHLVSTYIPLTQKGANSGVATLDTGGKIPEAQLPDSVFGGMRFVGDAYDGSAYDTTAEIKVFADTYVTNNGGDYRGLYFIWNGQDETCTVSTGHIVRDPSDISGTYVYLEAGETFKMSTGDWFIGVNDDGTEWAIIRNHIDWATTTSVGLVRLSDAVDRSDLVNGSNDVMTENFFYDNILADGVNLDGATNANKIAPAQHKHDGIYYTETEISNFLDGTTAKSGYNKTNWDNAYGDKINSASFNDATGDLTLTRQDSGTVVVNLDDRYLTEPEVETKVLTDLLVYGSAPSSTVTGAILIDED